jgi:hypothetical protein
VDNPTVAPNQLPKLGLGTRSLSGVAEKLMAQGDVKEQQAAGEKNNVQQPQPTNETR